jgi:hypothetical protein
MKLFFDGIVPFLFYKQKRKYNITDTAGDPYSDEKKDKNSEIIRPTKIAAYRHDNMK